MGAERGRLEGARRELFTRRHSAPLWMWPRTAQPVGSLSTRSDAATLQAVRAPGIPVPTAATMLVTSTAKSRPHGDEKTSVSRGARHPSLSSLM